MIKQCCVFGEFHTQSIILDLSQDYQGSHKKGKNPRNGVILDEKWAYLKKNTQTAKAQILGKSMRHVRCLVITYNMMLEEVLWMANSLVD